MTADDDFGGFAPPPFNAENALHQIKRGLRDLKLAEKGLAFELRGKRVAELNTDDGAIQVKLTRKLALTPEWDRFTIKSHTEQRKLLADLKQRLERWEREE
jgi:hypothetical protein